MAKNILSVLFTVLLITGLVVGGTDIGPFSFADIQPKECGWHEVTHPETGETYSSIDEFLDAVEEETGEKPETQQDLTVNETTGTVHQQFQECET